MVRFCIEFAVVALACIICARYNVGFCKDNYDVPASNGSRAMPDLVLWAWQRAEDLTFINPNKTAVAYMACNVFLHSDSLTTRWRDQPIKVPPGTCMVPVVRVDVDRSRPPSLSASQCRALADIVVSVAKRKAVSMVQIDFDALQSERAFYTQLVTEIKQRLPGGCALSITALASWCIFDNWIRNLPVEETVPMMFSLGRDRDKVCQYFASGGDFRDSRCHQSLGLSLTDREVNKLMIPLAKRRKMPVRIYLFSRTAWTPAKVTAAFALSGGK